MAKQKHDIGYQKRLRNQEAIEHQEVVQRELRQLMDKPLGGGSHG